jgi:hypothetical protein
MGDGNQPPSEPLDQAVPAAVAWPDWDEPLSPTPAIDSRAAVSDAATRAAGGRHLSGGGGLPRGRGPQGRHGRHARPASARDGRGRTWATGARLVTIAVIVAAVLIPVGALGLRLAGTGGGAPVTEPSGDLTEAQAPARATGGGSASNLLANWSFERDLAGWRTVGGAELERETGGHTSGSAALVRVAGARQAGISEPAVVGQAAGGERYSGSAWVRSDTKGTAVTVCVFSGAGAKRKESDKTRTLRPGAWVRVMVVHQVPPGGGEVGIEVRTARGAIVVDEVTLARV